MEATDKALSLSEIWEQEKAEKKERQAKFKVTEPITEYPEDLVHCYLPNEWVTMGRRTGHAKAAKYRAELGAYSLFSDQVNGGFAFDVLKGNPQKEALLAYLNNRIGGEDPIELTLEEPLEIERKFLVDGLPENPDDILDRSEIIQGYITITEEMEDRLRKKGDRYFRTVKEGIGKTRVERESEITKDEFDELWPQTEGKRVEKERFVVRNPHIGDSFELDFYHGDLEGLQTVEVEFDTNVGSDHFEAPAWFGKEVTEDKNFKNKKLATEGIPEGAGELDSERLDELIALVSTRIESILEGNPECLRAITLKRVLGLDFDDDTSLSPKQ